MLNLHAVADTGIYRTYAGGVWVDSGDDEDDEDSAESGVVFVRYVRRRGSITEVGRGADEREEGGSEEQ